MVLLPLWGRVLLFVALVAVAGFALPIAAATVEGISGSADNWILVVYVAMVVAVGAVMGAVIPRSSAAATRRGRALRWAGLGLLAAAITSVAWFVVLSG